jgi:hypothetical protein
MAVKNPFYHQPWKRALRSYCLRNFDAHANKPKLAGNIVAHIVDLENDESLGAQLRFLREREVKTFRLYTNRPKDIAGLFASDDVLKKSAHAVIDVSSEKAKRQIWKLVDNYNMGLPVDRWSLLLRAGEFLLYPYVETRTLPDLCQFLFDEGRRSLFCISLDLYPIGANGGGLTSGSSNWAFDRFGYSFKFDEISQVDRWHGGFLYRFPNHLRAFGRPDLSRTPLTRTGRRVCHTRDLNLALPRRLNLANSTFHLSPTGCIVSNHAYRFFMWRGSKDEPGDVIAKLTSAPRLEMDWRHQSLVTNGLMNEGQWL